MSGLVDDRPEAVVDRVGRGAAAERVAAAAVGVARLGLDHGGPVGDDLLELLDGQVGLGQGDVGRQEHPVVGDEADLLVHPAVEGPNVGVEGGDVVGELVLDVVGGRGEHQGLVDPLLVHQGQAQVTVPEGLRLVPEVGDEGLALLVARDP